MIQNNVGFDVMCHLEKNPDDILFEIGDANISKEVFRNIVISMALHMKNHDIDQSSCVGIDCEESIIAIALTLAISLHGCSWIRLTTEMVDIPITHIIQSTSREFESDTIPIIKIDDSWLYKPDNVDLSQPINFTGHNSPDSIWMIAQSSGTTGQSKFIPISYNSYWQRVNNDIDSFLSNIDKINILYYTLKSSVHYRAHAAILNDVIIVDHVDSLINHDNILVVGSLGQVHSFVDKIQVPAVPFNATVDLAGAASNKSDVERMLKYFSTVRLCYGSTETGRTYQKNITNIDQYNGSVGKKLSDNIVLQYDTNHVIKIMCSKQVDGYISDADGFKDGWFYPGDLGYLQDDELYITGRTKEQFNIGGIKINPSAIDDFINSIDGVDKCLTFLDDTMCAIIVSSSDQTIIAKSIFDSCLIKFGPSKIPKKLYFMNTVPIGVNGKFVRKDGPSLVQNINPVELNFS